jgi:hypothetical protein
VTLTLFDPAFVSLSIDPDSAAWFARVEAAGSTFVSGAKVAYNNFFVSEKANGNLAAFDNGMLLSFAGFSGLGGSFVPIRSRGGALPTNVGFVAGQKSPNALQGNGSAYINCGIGALSGQLNNHCMGSYGTTGSASVASGFGMHIGARNSSGGDFVLELFRNNNAANTVGVRSSSDTFVSVSFTGGICFVNRSTSSAFTIYHQASTTNSSIVSSAISLSNIGIFSAAGTASSLISDRQCHLAFWGDALPNPTAFRTACNTLMTELGVA